MGIIVKNKLDEGFDNTLRIPGVNKVQSANRNEIRGVYILAETIYAVCVSKKY